jgi:N-acetylneuraminic acid mutarotase
LDKWVELAALSGRRDQVAAVVLDGKIAVGSGVGPAFNSVETYDPASDSWIPGTEMQDTRAGFAAVAIDGRIYVAGGEVLVAPYSVRDTAEVFDPSSNTGRFEAKLPMPLHGVGAVAFEGKMYMFGGASSPMSATPRTSTVNILTP